ncbi:HAMP domain-containing sensor histidine kinase [Haloplanus salilacus]|uniref:sensor histidine kinase n=1 Tax=Haloplanus salilacus TaxID=2949994 RepID=UPI0030CF22CA
MSFERTQTGEDVPEREAPFLGRQRGKQRTEKETTRHPHGVSESETAGNNKHASELTGRHESRATPFPPEMSSPAIGAGGSATIVREDYGRPMTDECDAAIPLDAFPDPVLAYAIDGGEARITTRNESFERRFENTAPESLVSTVFERFSHSTVAGDQDPITHLVRGDRVGIYLDGDGDQGPFFARVVPSDGDAGYLVFSDLQQCPSIGEVPAVDQVSSVISHDLRNPLDVAKAHLTAARETGEPEHFESVAEAHDRMERIIRDVLTLTRDAVVDPSEQVSVETAATDAWQSVDTDGATLDLVGSLPTVTADADQVRRLFENLFRNSVEHNTSDRRAQDTNSVEHSTTDNRVRSRGSVERDSDAPAANTHREQAEWDTENRDQSRDRSDETPVERRVTVTVGALADGFYVADDGTGIPADERETVFEPGHSTMDGGTGLGLAIVEQIIAAHDWSVALTTSDSGGARFEVRF